MELYFNFYQTRVMISSDEPEILRLLALDFSYFQVLSLGLEQKEKAQCLQLCCRALPPIPPNLVAKKQTPQYLLYRQDKLKIVDYYGQALCLQNEEKGEHQLFSPSIERLHETAYLFILSVVGKDHDRRGLHKLHSFAIKRNGTSLLGAMPMKGGKTSSFLQFLQDPSVEIISDDCPLIDRQGNILPFPLRVGCDHAEILPPGNKELLYTIERSQYGRKVLAPLSYFNNKVAKSPAPRTILVFGVRSTYQSPVLVPLSFLKTLRQLSTHLIAGVGLPMVVEFFLQATFKDYYLLMRIAVSRSIAAFNLARKSKSYLIYLSSNIKENTALMVSIK